MSKIPLLVHILFHPESTAARQLALSVHDALNEDPVVPGLHVPTLFAPLAANQRFPAPCPLDVAEKSFVIVLADNKLALDDEWCKFVADTWQTCKSSKHRMMPIQLSNAAFPLDQRLKGVSFTRAVSYQDPTVRHAFVLRRVVIELCRYLMNLDSPNDATAAPVKLFLSHTKLDLQVEPKVTLQLIDHLKADQPVEGWVDSGDIPAGSEFAKAIEEGVNRTSLLVVLTDKYATREWCRKEVLLAKEKERPVVVIDALSQHEVRSFPYLGNVPVMRWDGQPQKAIDLLLKETLRDLHARMLLERFKQAGDILSVRPPELATLVGVQATARVNSMTEPSTVVYPDPPIGVEEAKLLSRANIKFTTPLQRFAESPNLRNKLVALSMSESTDTRQFGFESVHLEATMLELSRYLLIKGATLAYGGHLGASGYTQRLFEIVRAHNDLESMPACNRLVNFRGWPLPRLTEDQLAELKSVSKTLELDRPSEITPAMHEDFVDNPAFFPAEKSALHRYAWACGMTKMREYQADQQQSGVCARIVIGGTFGPTVKVKEDGSRAEAWYASRIPGVLEEVMLSIRARQPLFLIGAFGGVAKLVIDLLTGRERHEATWDYQQRAPHAPAMRDMYGNRWWDYEDMVKLLRDTGIAGVNSLLSEAEHLELFSTMDPLRMVEIVLLGLGRLKQDDSGSGNQQHPS